MNRLKDTEVVIAACLGALVVLGATIRIIVAGQDLFADELATYWVISAHDLPGVVQTVSTTAEITPPLGFMASWLTSQIDLVPELIRLPALLAGIATIPLVYLVGCRTVGRSAALLAAALAAVSPFMIFYSAEARGYGLLMAFILLSTLSLLLAIDEGRRRWWFAYGLFVLLAAYTHYTSIFVLAGQFAWALWAHPNVRKRLLLATAGAAVLYIPWLPSLKGDLDSPTTDILGTLLPFTPSAVRGYLGQWLVGSNFTDVNTLPGNFGLVLLASGLLLGAVGLWIARDRIRARLGAYDGRILLIVGLAVITPLAEALASLVSTNIFSARNLAASWPYVALSVGAFIAAGERRLRIAAAALLVGGLAIGAVKLTAADYSRPDYTGIAEYAAAGPDRVIVDGSAFTPGPLTNFDTEYTDPGVPVYRLNVPEQKVKPFNLADTLPDPTELAERVVAESGGVPITVVSVAGINPFTGNRNRTAIIDAFVQALPPGYELTDTRTWDGFLDLQAETYERAAPPP